MPFITQDRRELIDTGQLLVKEYQAGDYCYCYYSRMVKKWKEEPRWTTAHNIYSTLENTPAAHLAWQMFFQLYVMPYELKKRELNGDI